MLAQCGNVRLARYHIHIECACRGTVTRRTTELITLFLLPLSILMVCYALFVYHFRNKFLKKKQARLISVLQHTLAGLCITVSVAASRSRAALHAMRQRARSVGVLPDARAHKAPRSVSACPF